jgi:hypothetical protein
MNDAVRVSSGLYGYLKSIPGGWIPASGVSGRVRSAYHYLNHFGKSPKRYAMHNLVSLQDLI